MKKWTKILCCALLVGLFSVCTLTGCATVGNITNSNKELIYNGNAAVMVDGHLYFGNAYADISSFSSDADYKANAGKSYLARVNTNGSLDAKTKDYSPKNVENVSDEVTAYSKSFMFVLGQQIYYATPNRQKVSSNDSIKNEYSYTCLYTSKLNGDSKKKIYTTTAEISQIEVLKTENTYFIVFLAGDKLIKINLSNNKAETIAEEVKSVAMPKTYQKDKVGSTLDWNGYVYFTKALSVESGSGRTGNVVNRVKLSGGAAEEIYNQGTDISFVGRERDDVFFTETKNGTAETYLKTMTNHDFASFDARISSSISDISLIATNTVKYGYIYTAGSSLAFRTSSGKSGVITLTNGGETLTSYKKLLVTGRTMYVSTTKGIFRADISGAFNGTSTTVECEKIVEMTSIYEGSLCAFDGNYVYYYAQLETVDTDEDGETDDEETDSNFYLHRAKIGRTNDYQLLGLTQIGSRHSN